MDRLKAALAAWLVALPAHAASFGAARIGPGGNDSAPPAAQPPASAPVLMTRPGPQPVQSPPPSAHMPSPPPVQQPPPRQAAPPPTPSHTVMPVPPHQGQPSYGNGSYAQQPVGAHPQDPYPVPPPAWSRPAPVPHPSSQPPHAYGWDPSNGHPRGPLPYQPVTRPPPPPPPPRDYAVPMPRPSVDPWGPPATVAGHRPGQPAAAPFPDPARSVFAANGRSRGMRDDLRRFGDVYRPLGGRDAHATAFRRPDGVEVISVYDTRGRLTRRYRRHPDGYERTLVDAGWAPYAGARALAALPPPVPSFADKTVEVETVFGAAFPAGPSDIGTAMSGTLGSLPRAFSLDEILGDPGARRLSPGVRIDLPLFAAGSAKPSASALRALEPLALGWREILARSPDEVYLVEGYAPGGDAALATRRAEALAEALTARYGIPAENLVVLGLPGNAPQAALRRITPLLRGGEP